jgi:hypothetical protein
MRIDEIMATTKTHKSTVTRALNKEHPQQVRGAFAAVLRRITVQEPERLSKVAKVLFDQAEAGNLNAITILFDRLDGRPHQQIEMSGNLDVKTEVLSTALERISQTIEKIRQSDQPA